MDLLNLTESGPGHCPWPCKLGLVVVAVMIVVGLVRYFRKTSGSNKL